MFLPLIRNFISYSQNVPIDFICLLAVVLFIINLIYKYKKMLVIFFLCATTYIIFSSVNLNNMGTDDIHTVTIPKELLKMKMKDTPSIYLFMHDAFPHKDLREELNLDCRELDNLLKKYEFKEYDVYSLGCATLVSLSSLFTMEKHNYLKSFSSQKEHMIDIISGDNWIQQLLASNGYFNFVATCNYKYNFNEKANSVYRSFKRKLKGRETGEARYYLVHAIIYGTMNMIKLDDMIQSTINKEISLPWTAGVLELSDFICSYAGDRNKIFAWGCGYPSHSSRSGQNFDMEMEMWFPKYLKSIKQIKEELDSVINQNPNAIIILMSDHGPYLFFENEDHRKKEIYTLFRDVYGAFMAIRWPDKEKVSKYDKDFNVTQDLFAIILAYLYDSYLPLKYKIKDTSVKVLKYKVDRGEFYKDFYKKEEGWAE
jgi:hypothetical protein